MRATGQKAASSPSLLVSKSTAVDSVTTWVLRLRRDGHIGSSCTGSVRAPPRGGCTRRATIDQARSRAPGARRGLCGAQCRLACATASIRARAGELARVAYATIGVWVYRTSLKLSTMSRQFGLLLPLLLAAPAPPASSATTEPDIAGMWRELEAHCSAGRCTRATGSRADDSSAALWQDKITDSPTGAATDCKGRMLAYEYGLKLLPSRKPQLESFDALELHTTCGVSRPRASKPLVPDLRVPTGATFHVDHAFGSDSAGGSVDAPFRTIHRALAECRASSADAKNIVLKPGVHYLTETIDLGPADSGTTITAARGSAPGDVVVSGGALLTPTWKKSSRKSPNASAGQIWETKVPAALGAFKGLTTLSPHRRVTRARFPNAGAAEGAELCTGHCWASGIKEWHKNTSCVGKATVVYKDLRDCDDNMKIASGPLAGQPCKNDSAMWDTYNTYSSGHGGCCAAWSGDQSPYGPMGNYFCGNASAGGWVGRLAPPPALPCAPALAFAPPAPT
eukprot:COSAG02_NODE_1149_length_14210_cov_40.850542_10_plen_510_part_00